MTCFIASHLFDYKNYYILLTVKFRYHPLYLFVLSLFVITGGLHQLCAQNLSFELKVSPSVNMVFNTIEKYQNGLVQYNFSQLNIDADMTWDLYVGANTSTQDEWDEDMRYSNSGATPDVSILQLRFRNAGATSQENGFFPLQDINNPVYIIGSAALNPEIACGNVGANAAGDYITSPGCHQFNLDMLIKPGLTYRPGLYKLEIVFTLVENL